MFAAPEVVSFPHFIFVLVCSLLSLQFERCTRESLPWDWNNVHFAPILRRLVLGCIDADFDNQICIFQHFSRATRFTYFCTAQNPFFQQKHPHNFGQNEMKWTKFHFIHLNFCIKKAKGYFSSKFRRKKSGISQMCSKISEFVEIPAFIFQFLQKICKNSGNVAVVHSCRMNGSIPSLVLTMRDSIRKPLECSLSSLLSHSQQAGNMMKHHLLWSSCLFIFY